MKLFLISQYENTGYDTYDSAVVAAPSEEVARNTDPSARGEDETEINWNRRQYSWCSSPEEVEVTYLGEAAEGTKQSVILASFNAG